MVLLLLHPELIHWGGGIAGSLGLAQAESQLRKEWDIWIKDSQFLKTGQTYTRERQAGVKLLSK